jgi:hypothetical protein
MDRFFKIIRRVNSVLFLIVLLGVGALSAWYAWRLYDWYQNSDSYGADNSGTDDEAAADEAEPAPATFLTLGDAEVVTGTGLQMFRLTTEAMRYADRGEEIRNILFLPAGAQHGVWLFPTQDNLILEADQIRPWRGDDVTAPTMALYFQFVPGDPEDKTGPSQYDLFTVALTRSDGSGMIEVLREVEEVLSYEQLESGILSIVYRDLAELRLTRIALDSFIILSDAPVATIPERL